MDIKEMSEDIWRELHKLNSIKRINRAEFRLWKETCCAYRDHQLYFSETEDAFLESMIMGIGRLLDRTKGVLSIKKWLMKAEKEKIPGIDLNQLSKAKMEYENLLRSEEAKIILDIRHNYYAHTQPSWNREEVMKRITWKQIFETIERLQEIFNSATRAGLGNPSSFGEETIHVMGFPASNIEKDMRTLLLSIEKDCHADDKHAWQIERANMAKNEES